MGLPITMTETDTPANTIVYGNLDLTLSRSGLDYDTTLPVKDVRRFHPPGVDGQYLVRLGQTSRKITLRVRYLAVDKAALEALYEGDVAGYAIRAYNILVNAQTYTNCNILDARAMTPLRPIGRPDATNKVFRDYEFTFTQDGS